MVNRGGERGEEWEGEGGGGGGEEWEGEGRRVYSTTSRHGNCV